jgi:hypothetical protein
MQPANPLQIAYQRAKLARHGITFDDAMANPMFKTCLGRIAEAISRPHVPLPKHATATKWQPFKD